MRVFYYCQRLPHWLALLLTMLKHNCTRCKTQASLVLTRWLVFSQPAGHNLCLRCPRPIAAKLADRSICGLLPQIDPFSMCALTRPARRDLYPRYVRPTSAHIKGATTCLHFVRGVWKLIPEVTPLTRFAFRNPRGATYVCAARDLLLQNSSIGQFVD